MQIVFCGRALVASQFQFAENCSAQQSVSAVAHQQLGWSHSHPRFTGLYTMTSGVSLPVTQAAKQPASEVSAYELDCTMFCFVNRSIRLYVFADYLSSLLRFIAASLLRIFVNYRDICRLRSNSATSSTFTFSPP